MSTLTFGQKDSLQLGDRYAEDQLYFSMSYAQLYNQPSVISRSTFSYALSAGFMKDLILTDQGNVSLAFGVGYGFEYFNHSLKVSDISSTTVFDSFSDGQSGIFKSQNIEFPIELRWRTSNAKKYKFWRIYPGIKFLYNLSHEFITESNSSSISVKNISEFNNFQYGLTLSVGYDLVNFNIFYGLTPLFDRATLNEESINRSIVKLGLTFYLL